MTLRAVTRWVIGAPLLLLMVLFALSNREPVRIGLFPTDLSIEMPLSVALLAAAGVGFFLGGFRVWIAALRHRRIAKQAQDTLRVMEAKGRELKTLPPGSLLAPPA